MTPAEHVAHIVRLLNGYRYTYGNELALHDGIQAALETNGETCEREHHIDAGRVDLYLPTRRVAIEAKVAGTPGDVLRQITRYASCANVDGVVLVTSRMQHGGPPELAGKPAGYVYLGRLA